MIFNFFFKIITGYLLADIIAGVYHWIKDTYFSPFTPIIGKRFVWGSRLHHVRPKYVTEFDDVSLLFDSAKWVALWMIPLMYYFGLNIFLISLFLVLSANDVIHKYAHMSDKERPQWASFLQKIYIFQSSNEHHLHHTYPYITNYCPISPFLNVIIEKIQLWRTMEKYIEEYLGIKAREKEYDFIEDNDYPAGIKFIQS